MEGAMRYDGTDAERIAREDCAKGERYMAEARTWIDANPRAWDYIVSQALRSASMHRRFGMKALCEHVRWHFSVVEGHSEFKLNNNYTAPFTRLLLSQHPEVGPYIATRTSAVDLCA